MPGSLGTVAEHGDCVALSLYNGISRRLYLWASYHCKYKPIYLHSQGGTVLSKMNTLIQHNAHYLELCCNGV